MDRAAYGSQVIVTTNNLLLSLSAIMFLEGENFKVWFIVSQTFFITQTFLRSAYFEPANFHSRQLKVTTSRISLIFLFASTFNFLVIGFTSEFNFTKAFVLSLAVTFSLYQDYLRYKFISIQPRNVVIADSLVLILTILLIISAETNSAILFTGLYIALPNIISILYLNYLSNEDVFKQEVFKLQSKPIYSLSSFIELGLNQTLTVMSAIFLSNTELRNLRAMMLIAAPLTSLRLFSWSGLIVRTKKFKSREIKKDSKLTIKFALYSPIAVLLFILSESSFLFFLPKQSNSSLALILLTTLISLTFVEKAVIIRKLGNIFHIIYFSASFPLVSIAYFAFLGDKSDLNQLLMCQFVVTLLNAILSLLILRGDKLRD